MDIPLFNLLLRAAVLAGIVLATYLLVRYLLGRWLLAFVVHNRPAWLSIIERRRLVRWTTYAVTALVGVVFLPIVTDHLAVLGEWSRLAGTSLVLFLTALALNALINVAIDVYDTYPLSRQVPLTALAQILKVLVFLFLGFMGVSLLLGVSPIYSISVLVAVLAALSFILQDIIRNIVAGLQLAGNRMVAIGDWIEMPEYGADGSVLEVNVTAVKVQNWDRAIVTVPTNAMVTHSFKNWRAMQDSNGRRIQRSVIVDVRTIVPAAPELVQRFAGVPAVRDYLAGFELVKDREPVQPGPTNVGLFCANLREFLIAHPKVEADAVRVVRYLHPVGQGLPVEVTVFSREKDLVPYEALQASIFEYVYATLPAFGLRAYQAPAAEDVAGMLREDAAKVTGEL